MIKDRVKLKANAGEGGSKKQKEKMVSFWIQIKLIIYFPKVLNLKKVFFVDRMRQANATQGKKDLKKDVIMCQKKIRGKMMMQQNKLSTKAFLNQAIFEMKRGLYSQAVENFNIVIEENNERGLPFVLRSKCLMM